MHYYDLGAGAAEEGEGGAQAEAEEGRQERKEGRGECGCAEDNSLQRRVSVARGEWVQLAEVSGVVQLQGGPSGLFKGNPFPHLTSLPR